MKKKHTENETKDRKKKLIKFHPQNDFGRRKNQQSLTLKLIDFDFTIKLTISHKIR